jgi:hypothetical protein
MKTLNNIFYLKLIEYFVHLFTFFFITYDYILPKNIANNIYDFGVFKLFFIIYSILIFLYAFYGFKEKEYIKNKFTKKHLIYSTVVFTICLVIYFLRIF